MPPSQRPPPPPGTSLRPPSPPLASQRPPAAPKPAPDDWESRPRYRALLAALREVVGSARTLKDLLLNARDLLHALLDAERVNLFATDPGNTALWTLARSGGGAAQRLPRTYASIPGFVAITRRAVTVRNAYDVEELRALHPELRHDPARDVGMPSRTRQVLAAPVLSERGVVGVIEFVNSLDGMDFRPDDARLAEEVCRLLGPAVAGHLGALAAKPEAARFGMLVAQGLVTEAQLGEALARARSGDGDVAAVLGEQHRVPRDAIGRSLADWHHLRFFAWDGRYRMTRALLERVSPNFMRGQVCAPVALSPDGTLLFVVEDPDNLGLLDAIRARRLAARIELLVGLRRDILGFIDASLASPAPSGVQAHPPILDVRSESPSLPAAPATSQRPGGQTDGDVVRQILDGLDERASTVPDEPDAPDDDAQGADAVIARLVRHMVLDAAARGASDLHIEPEGTEGPCRVRLRIDGDCTDYAAVPAVHRQALVQRIKVLADVDIAERRRPQDGRFRVKGPGGTVVEVRVASLPTVGENEDVVLRLLSAWRPLPLEELAFSARNLTTFREMISQPFGIVLVVGPTGSGKTTTLHAALGHLNTPDMKILTVEDPVEIVQPGLRQVQVNARIGLGFPEALRAFLRADPDVIMVGEMRDRVTAAVGIEAALTGHLVLSTLQANTAPETLTRLIGMDIDTMALADALRGVLAQRLVRKLCDDCKAPYSPTPEEWQRLGDAYGDDAFAAAMAERDEGPVTRRPVGCSRCRGTGYRGRIALHELLPGTEPIKALVRRRAPLDEIRREAASVGVRTMLQDGVEKVLEGLTDFRQVRAACVV